jgi:ribA/ribD-fused uncharacterized protein
MHNETGLVWDSINVMSHTPHAVTEKWLLDTILVIVYLEMNEIRFYREDAEWGEFCNFYKAPIHFNGQTYPTSEHLYQAMKFYDGEQTSELSLEYMELIRTTSTPYKSKILGHQTLAYRHPWQQQLNQIITKYKDKGLSPVDGWEERRLQFMYDVLLLKFTQNKHCCQVLLSTEDATLIEGAYRDYYWGEGKDRTGYNHLGRLLMQIRAKLRE